MNVLSLMDSLASELLWSNVRDIKNGRNYQFGTQTKITVYTSRLDHEEIPEVALSPKGLGRSSPLFWLWVSYLQNCVGAYAKPKFSQKYPRVAIANDAQLAQLILCLREYALDNEDQRTVRDRLSDSLVNRPAWNRRGQSDFRTLLFEEYAGSCAISGCRTEPAVEAAHVVPYRHDHAYEPTNGLPLRADLHSLFDARLIAIHPNTRKVVVAADALGDYSIYQDKELGEPRNRNLRVTEANLRVQYREFEQRNECTER
ncbi:HNH endonuclease [Stutzerimonas zhaodongensis]|uniref:HNH endonuclease n=1 Tax=Stutzerimonas zhaodongensis TaxID=1176257 RepID=A0A3M2HI20_9GAMM|nr:HNH endonuclease signature motif containing protein [Stutzerimonas zhaodongensis]MCQ4315807.1 HNH endonuclease [Stutzerimonas zhaodongensis]RMH89366.1 HNH endonuclease [Stutzerimonas zhaodongensis]